MKFMKKIKWLFVGFLFGSAVGGAIALLYAPESGKHLRRDISKKTNELIEDGKKIASDSWKDVKGKAESTFENANEFLNTKVGKMFRKTEKVNDDLTSGINADNDELKSGKN